MFMIQLMVNNIIDVYFNFSFKDVPKVFRKAVKEGLIAAGAGELADVKVVNYQGPRPKDEVVVSVVDITTGK